MLSLFQLTAALLTTTAAFAWINHRFLRLPPNIGLLMMGLAASGCLIGLQILFPHIGINSTLIDALRQIDFSATLMQGALAFLLFAGALHVDWGKLRQRSWVVGIMATIGVAISTAVVGIGLWITAGLLDLALPLTWALVFGALIAPTDPVAVLSTLKQVDVPEVLETDMSGEALFNDGIGVVLFTILLSIASSSAGGEDSGSALMHGLRLLFIEAGGGILLGLATGYIAYRAQRSIDEYTIEILITLALVTSTYAIATEIHVSGPISVVVAGLLIGNRGMAKAMSQTTQRYLCGFWTLLDDILNAMLFLLIGLEVLVVGFDARHAWLAIAAVPLVLLARLVAVTGAVFTLRHQSFVRGTIPVLTWGGVRGGISVALALSLPYGDERTLILAATYGVVLFTIIVQGLSLAPVVRACIDSSH